MHLLDPKEQIHVIHRDFQDTPDLGLQEHLQVGIEDV